jgi:hypothetical protein
VDLSHYSVSAPDTFTFPSVPNDSSVTTQVSYNLTSSDSSLVVVFLFQGGVLYQIAQRTVSGLVVTARNFTNLDYAAFDFLSRYESVAPVDLTPLVRLVQMLNGSMSTEVSAGNLTLYASSGPILPGHTAASFDFVCLTDNSTVSLGFDNGVFYNFEYFGFTSQDSEAAMKTLPTPTPTATSSNLSLDSHPSATVSSQPQNEQQTLLYIMASVAGVIVAAGIVAVYQWVSAAKMPKQDISR